MGLMDNVKGKLGLAGKRAGELAHQHGDAIGAGLETAGRAVDAKTGGKHSGKIRSGVAKAKDAIAKTKHESDGTPGAQTAPRP